MEADDLLDFLAVRSHIADLVFLDIYKNTSTYLIRLIHMIAAVTFFLNLTCVAALLDFKENKLYPSSKSHYAIIEKIDYFQYLWKGITRMKLSFKVSIAAERTKFHITFWIESQKHNDGIQFQGERGAYGEVYTSQWSDFYAFPSKKGKVCLLFILFLRVFERTSPLYTLQSFTVRSSSDDIIITYYSIHIYISIILSSHSLIFLFFGCLWLKFTYKIFHDKYEHFHRIFNLWFQTWCRIFIRRFFQAKT